MLETRAPQMRALLVDDFADWRKSIRRSLQRDENGALDVREAATFDEACGALESWAPHLAVLDVHLDRSSGFELLRRAQRLPFPPYCVIVSGSSDPGIPREAVRRGANDLIAKLDFSPSAVAQVVAEARARLRLAGLAAPSAALAKLVGTSEAIKQLRATIVRVASAGQREPPVLIRGETGTGKELVAQAVHELGPRAGKPFVAVNCSALPGALFEAHLFGHERGAFTGAERTAPGLLEVAGAGTLFLDEVGDLPLELQPKILRVLETRTFVRVGGVAEIPLRARVLAATHANLEELVAAKRFRADLFHRLDVLRIGVPSLAERIEDMPALIAAILDDPTCRLSDSAVELLSKRAWPGNVRELRNALERTVSAARGGLVDDDCVRDSVGLPTNHTSSYSAIASAVASLPGSWPERLQMLERCVLEDALRVSGGNANAASRLLGVERKVVARRMQKLGIGRTRRPRRQ